MKIKRIIIHTENMVTDRSHDYWRIMAGLKEYARLRPDSKVDRLTVRFDEQGALCIYNNPSKIGDLVIFTEESA